MKKEKVQRKNKQTKTLWGKTGGKKKTTESARCQGDHKML